MALGNIYFTDQFVEDEILDYLTHKGFIISDREDVNCDLRVEVVKTYLTDYYRSDLLHDLSVSISKCPFNQLEQLVKKEKNVLDGVLHQVKLERIR